MIKCEKNTGVVEIAGSPIQLGIELTCILVSLKDSNLPMSCFASAIHTFLMNYESKDRIELLSMIKRLSESDK